jgi:hypothetical protein
MIGVEQQKNTHSVSVINQTDIENNVLDSQIVATLEKMEEDIIDQKNQYDESENESMRETRKIV